MAKTDPARTEELRRRIVTEAARLFAVRGFTATSTREIASAVGLRQSSLYYYFATKEAILVQLLGAAWEPALQQADRIVAIPAPADVRWCALLLTDLESLLALPFELGALYYVAEAKGPAFAELWQDRDRLRTLYLDLAAEAALAGLLLADARAGTPTERVNVARLSADLVFRVTESLAVTQASLAEYERVLELTARRCAAMLGISDVEATIAAARALLDH